MGSFFPKILDRNARGIKIRIKTMVKIIICKILPSIEVVLIKNRCAKNVNFDDTRLRNEISKAIHRVEKYPLNKKSKINKVTIISIDSFGFLLCDVIH